jgi:hypothetical protein
MGVVKGKNVVLMHNSKPVACIRTYSDTSSISFIETTTIGSGTGAEFKPQKTNNTASFEGVQFLNDAAKWTYPELKQAALDFTLFEDATVVATAEDGTLYTETFDFYIAGISRTGAAGDFSTFSIDIQINGNPVLS